jgi:hypothetical protein
MKNILEIYKKRLYNKYLIEKRAKIEEIENNDVIGKFVKETNEKYNELLKENGFDMENAKLIGFTVFTKTTVDAIEKVEKEFKDKMDDRDRLIEEIQAQVQITETYEQEMDIYKKYGVIDENGHLYDYR